MSADAGGIIPCMIEIRQLPYSELIALPGYADMFAAHVAACHVPEFGKPEENARAWVALEAAGAVRAFGAFEDGELAGFLYGVVSPGMHYAGCRRLSVDTLLVDPARRGQGIGRQLLDAAVRAAREEGCGAVMLSAPADSVAEKLYAGLGRRLAASFVLKA